MSELIDPVFAKTGPTRSFSITENERFELAFEKTGTINLGNGVGQLISTLTEGKR
jgi:hypothetical protein